MSIVVAASPHFTLPLELHAEVAEHVAQRELATLALCCRSFAKCAQGRLFRHLLLNHRTPRAEARKLFDVLVDAEHLGRCVRAFSIEWEGFEDVESSELAGLAARALQNMANLTFLSLSERAIVAPGTHLPALRRLQAAVLPPADFMLRHSSQLVYLAILPPHDDLTDAMLPPMPRLQELTTTAALAETLLAHGPGGQALVRMTVHARDRCISFPASPFLAKLATNCPYLSALWIVGWGPPQPEDERDAHGPTKVMQHPRIATLGFFLTYCYCVADMTCSTGAYLWEQLIASAASVLPNIESLEFPCSMELSDEADHGRPPRPIPLWRTPEAYTKHLPRLRAVHLGNGLSYVRRMEDGAFALDDGAQRLDTPFLCLPPDLRT